MKNRIIKVTLAWVCLSVAGSLVGVPLVTGQTESQSPQAPTNSVADQSLRDASLEGRLELMQKAVEQGARIDVADADGRTALMFAAFNGHTEAARWLLDRKASVAARENLGRTPLMFASTGPFAETVSLLLEKGSEPNAVDEYENWTALMFAAGEGQLEVVTILLEHGADPAAIDKDGDNAAYHAAQSRHVDVERLLRDSMK